VCCSLLWWCHTICHTSLCSALSVASGNGHKGIALVLSSRWDPGADTRTMETGSRCWKVGEWLTQITRGASGGGLSASRSIRGASTSTTAGEASTMTAARRSLTSMLSLNNAEGRHEVSNLMCLVLVHPMVSPGMWRTDTYSKPCAAALTSRRSTTAAPPSWCTRRSRGWWAPPAACPGSRSASAAFCHVTFPAQQPGALSHSPEPGHPMDCLPIS
jgi:hypothetical protein